MFIFSFLCGQLTTNYIATCRITRLLRVLCGEVTLNSVIGVMKKSEDAGTQKNHTFRVFRVSVTKKRALRNGAPFCYVLMR